MSRRSWIVVGVLFLPMLWLLLASSAPLWANGWFYQVKQPVPITKHGRMVTLHYRRFMRFPMHVECTTRLSCRGAMTWNLPSRHCPNDTGWLLILITYPLPDDEYATGNCQYLGETKYRPLGGIGPKLTYSWESVAFAIPTVPAVGPGWDGD